MEDSQKMGKRESYLYSVTLANGDVHTVETTQPLNDIIAKNGEKIKVGDIHMGTNTIEINGESFNIYTAPADSVLEK